MVEIYGFSRIFIFESIVFARHCDHKLLPFNLGGRYLLFDAHRYVELECAFHEKLLLKN